MDRRYTGKIAVNSFTGATVIMAVYITHIQNNILTSVLLVSSG